VTERLLKGIDIIVLYCKFVKIVPKILWPLFPDGVYRKCIKAVALGNSGNALSHTLLFAHWFRNLSAWFHTLLILVFGDLSFDQNLM